MRIAAGCSIHVSNIFAQIGRCGWHVIFFESLHQGHLIGCLLALAFQMEQLGSVCMSKVWLLTSCPIDRKRRLMQSVNFWCEVWIEKYVVMSLSVHVTACASSAETVPSINSHRGLPSLQSIQGATPVASQGFPPSAFDGAHPQHHTSTTIWHHPELHHLKMNS